jgi:hypothetical protein
MEKALVIRSGLEPQIVAMAYTRRLPSSQETDSLYWLTMLSSTDTLRTWSITLKRSTGTGDFAGQCRLLTAVGGYTTIPTRLTAIAHLDAPYMATITNEGRVCVWSLSQAHVVVDDAGRPPLHYEAHFDAKDGSSVVSYTHIAWSPFARSGKGLRLFCGGHGFVDIYSLPSIGGISKRDPKGLPFTWRKIGRLRFPSDSSLVGVHAVPFPTSNSPFILCLLGCSHFSFLLLLLLLTEMNQVMVTVVTNRQVYAWCIPHQSWQVEAKIASVIPSEPFHTIELTDVAASASHALPPLRSTNFKAALSDGKAENKGPTTSIDAPGVFAASSTGVAKPKRQPRTVSGAFVVVGLVSGAIRVIELGHKQIFTLHQFTAHDAPVQAIKALSLSRMVTQSIVNDELAVWEAESDITTYRREATLPVVATSNDSKRDSFGAPVASRPEGKEAKAPNREGAPSAARKYLNFSII